MTRINVIPVGDLSVKHLVAEYRELPRIYKASLNYFNNGEKYPLPEKYVLGTGHMKFFYDKLSFIQKRHQELIDEMIRRGYNPNFSSEVDTKVKNLPSRFWKDYIPTIEAIKLNRDRIKERTKV